VETVARAGRLAVDIGQGFGVAEVAFANGQIESDRGGGLPIDRNLEL